MPFVSTYRERLIHRAWRALHGRRARVRPLLAAKKVNFMVFSKEPLHRCVSILSEDPPRGAVTLNAAAMGGVEHVYGIFFLCRQRSLLLFNQLAVAEQWGQSAQSTIADDIFETVVLVGAIADFDRIEVGRHPRLSFDWPAGGIIMGPVDVVPLSKIVDEVFSVSDELSIDSREHGGKTYEYLLGMHIGGRRNEWALKFVPGFPIFLSLDII